MSVRQISHPEIEVSEHDDKSVGDVAIMFRVPGSKWPHIRVVLTTDEAERLAAELLVSIGAFPDLLAALNRGYPQG